MVESQRLWGMMGVNRQSHVCRVAVFAAKRKMASSASESADWQLGSDSCYSMM